ncbi:MAG: ABC transporter substrate-binding protein [Candidatus Ventricola sp.]
MKRFISLIILLALLALPAGVAAEDVTLRTVSCFAGTDASAEAYVELLKAFEEQTGCVIEDTSAASDESWKTSVLYDFAAGNEPDVLFFFAANADSAPILSRVVPIAEINAAYPALSLPEVPALRESDGRIYAIPVRSYWEGLFVNADLFARYDLELPTTWARLETAIARFREEGVVPISASLSDIPHYLAEMAVLVCGSPEDHAARPGTLEEVPQSWFDGMALIHRLYTLGAFADNVTATNESMASQLFRDKKAAMQIDGSWFANSIPAESMDTTLVMPMPAYSPDADPNAFIGGVSMGFYLTRRAWENPDRRDMAVRLLAWFAREENLALLGNSHLTGALQESAGAMLAHKDAMLRPFQDDMSKEAREVWLLDCVSAVAEGSMTAEACWARIMQLHPFED